MSSLLDAQGCVVTGTGRSIGRAAAIAFAREGASVVGCDSGVDAAQTIIEPVRGGGDRVFEQACQLTDPCRPPRDEVW